MIVLSKPPRGHLFPFCLFVWWQRGRWSWPLMWSLIFWLFLYIIEDKFKKKKKTTVTLSKSSVVYYQHYEPNASNAPKLCRTILNQPIHGSIPLAMGLTCIIFITTLATFTLLIITLFFFFFFFVNSYLRLFLKKVSTCFL